MRPTVSFRIALTTLALLFVALPRATAQTVKTIEPREVPVFAGDPAAIGRQQGTLWKDDIAKLVQGWLMPRLNTVPVLTEWFARLKARAMERHTPEALQTEMQALAAASGVEYAKVLISNAAPDISELAGAPFACSTFVALPSRSANGAVLYGRNLDYDKSEILRPYWKPVVFARTGKLKVLALTLPGLSGVLTAINEKGVMMSRMTSYSKDMSSHGVPTMLLFRQVLEEARTAEEAAELYVKAERTVAINIMITDPTNALVLEVAAKKFAVRTPNDAGVLYAANHYESPAMADGKHGRDERWPYLASRDGDDRPVTTDDVIRIMGKTGRKDGDNILAAVADYGAHRLIFGTDPNGHGPAALGPLNAVDWEAVFALAP